MPSHSGFTLIELLVSLTLTSVLVFGSLLTLLSARQHIHLATQYSIASAAMTELSVAVADSISLPNDWLPLAGTFCGQQMSCPAVAELESAVDRAFLNLDVTLLPDAQRCVGSQSLVLSWSTPLEMSLNRTAKPECQPQASRLSSRLDINP